ncbi:TetR/AcrR family transcriptional regulator [Rhizobium leguminosarum]
MNSQAKLVPLKSKGRPRSFDRTVALEQALDVFWRRGYEPTSISDLCAAMSIKPPSLYAAFGNKAQLFMEAVDYYERTYWDVACDRLVESGDISQAILRFFSDAAEILTSNDAPCGCLVVLGATNVSPESQEVHTALKALRLQGRKLFEVRLIKGIEDGQLSSDTDTAALGMALNALLGGMSLQAFDGASAQELQCIGSAASAVIYSSLANK